MLAKVSTLIISPALMSFSLPELNCDKRVEGVGVLGAEWDFLDDTLIVACSEM